VVVLAAAVLSEVGERTSLADTGAERTRRGALPARHGGSGSGVVADQFVDRRGSGGGTGGRGREYLKKGPAVTGKQREVGMQGRTFRLSSKDIGTAQGMGFRHSLIAGMIALSLGEKRPSEP